MILAVINFSGNVGKSTFCNHFLKLKYPNSTTIKIESINNDEGSNERDIKLNSADFDLLQDELLLNENVIVDIGASNAEGFVQQVKKWSGVIDDFNKFYIPVTKEKKQQSDTIDTILTLLELGVKADAIFIIFNRIENETKISSDFSTLITFLKENKIKANLELNIPETDFFQKAKNETIETILSDNTDFKSKILSSKDAEEKDALINKLKLNRLAMGLLESFKRLDKHL